MIPRTQFHCITTWVARPSILWFQFTSQMAQLSTLNFYFIARSDYALRPVHTRRLCRARPVVCDMSHRVDAKVVQKSVVHDFWEVVHDLEKSCSILRRQIPFLEWKQRIRRLYRLPCLLDMT